MTSQHARGRLTLGVLRIERLPRLGRWDDATAAVKRHYVRADEADLRASTYRFSVSLGLLNKPQVIYHRLQYPEWLAEKESLLSKEDYERYALALWL